MATQDDQSHGPEDHEEWEEEAPRSLFASTWFRVVAVVVVVGAVAAVSVPYVMDSVGSSSAPTTARAPAAPKPAAVASAPAPAPPPVASPAPAPVAAPTQAPAAAPPAPATVAPIVEKAPAAKSEAPKQIVQAPAPKAEPAKPAPAKPEAAKPEKTAPTRAAAARSTATPKADAPAKSEAKADAPKARGKAAAAASAAATGELWLQVGAFRDAATAKRVSGELQGKGFSTAESTLTRGGGTADGAAPSGGVDRYDVVVAGAPAEVTRKLTAKGLSAESVSEGAVVRPSLALRDAVTLSNDLRGEGFSVSVRRVGRAGAPASSTAGASGETLHRVRVGPYPDRAAADAASQKLRELGYTPFVARTAQ